jgi:hypothetical protein
MALNIDVTSAKRVAKAILFIRVLVGWVFLGPRLSEAPQPISPSWKMACTPPTVAFSGEIP